MGTSKITILCIPSNGRKTGATNKSTLPNNGNVIGDGNGCKTGATMESSLTNLCYTIRNYNKSKIGATKESTLSNARYAISFAIVGNGFGNDNRCEFTIVTTRYFHSTITCDFVEKVAGLEIVGERRDSYE